MVENEIRSDFEALDSPYAKQKAIEESQMLNTLLTKYPECLKREVLKTIEAQQ
jgi:hypothetical protein